MRKCFSRLIIFILGSSRSVVSGVTSSTTITIVNKCDQTVWPGTASNAGSAPLQLTGFALQKGESVALNAPPLWAGRLWGRTRCYEDSNGKFTCDTGDCGSGTMECAGASAIPPATVAQFAFNRVGEMVFYDVSLVDGFNVPMQVSPIGGYGPNCMSTGCTVDLNARCPSELKVMNSDGEVVACNSACVAFGLPEYCCVGVYGSSDKCKPSNYSQLFKISCPGASSYAYDEKNSTFTCIGADYDVIFCPLSTTSKKSKDEQQISTTPQFNTNVYAPLGNSSPTSGSSNHGVVISGMVAGVMFTIAFFGWAAYKCRNCNGVLNGSFNRIYVTQNP